MSHLAGNSNQSDSGDDIRLRISGMDCAEEVTVLKRELAPLVGDIDRLKFDVLNRKLTVQRGTPSVSASQLMAAVNNAGMTATQWEDRQSGRAETQPQAISLRTALTILSGVLGFSGFALHAWLAGGIVDALGSEGTGLNTGVPLLAVLLYIGGIIAGVWYVAPRAWRAARNLAPDMNLLMFIAVCGAASIGEWFEAATFLIPLGSITTGGNVTAKIQQSSDDGSSDAYSDLAGTSIAWTDADDNKVGVIEVDNPQKRYLKCVITRSTQDSVVDGIIAIQTKAKVEPVANGSTVVATEYHHAPVEGTA